MIYKICEIFFDFFGQKICTCQKIVVILHRKSKKSTFAVKKKYKIAAKILQKFDIRKKTGKKIAIKNQ